jgi:transaldolase
MKIFIDTADLQEIQEACSWGIVDGLTTNPTLVKRAAEARDHVDMESYIEQICRIVPGPVSLEVASPGADDMLDEAMGLYSRFNPVRQNVAIKIPANTSTGTEGPDYEGLKAIVALSERGIPVNATLVMTSEQALLCAKAGARFVSPFMGRVDDFEAKAAGADSTEPPSAGDRLVSEIVQIFRTYRFDCEVIAASVRCVEHVHAAALAGAQIATIPFPVLLKMARHPKTAEGIQRFTDDLVPAYSELLRTLRAS